MARVLERDDVALSLLHLRCPVIGVWPSDRVGIKKRKTNKPRELKKQTARRTGGRPRGPRTD